MATGNRIGGKKVQVLQIAIIVLLSLLLAFIVASEAARTGRGVLCEKAGLATVNQTVQGSAYVVRDEQTLAYAGAGPVRYATPDGGAVRQYDNVLTVYPGEGDDTKRVEAARLLDEIETLQALSAAAAFSPAEYETAYLAVMHDLSAGCSPRADARADLRACVATLRKPDADAIDAAIAEREAAFAELVHLVADHAVAKAAPFDGYLCRTTDGLEGLLTPAAAETLTPAGLSALLASSAASADAVGKVVGGTFSLLLPVTHAEADALTVGATYAVTLHASDETVTLTLTSLTRDESGALAYLTGGDGTVVPTVRAQEVTLTVATRTGIRVPMTALRQEGETLYVFVSENGKAAKRLVRPILYEDGYCLSDPTAGEGYLGEGEAVPVTGRRLYEGKTLR